MQGVAIGLFGLRVDSPEGAGRIIAHDVTWATLLRDGGKVDRVSLASVRFLDADQIEARVTAVTREIAEAPRWGVAELLGHRVVWGRYTRKPGDIILMEAAGGLIEFPIRSCFAFHPDRDERTCLRLDRWRSEGRLEDPEQLRDHLRALLHPTPYTVPPARGMVVELWDRLEPMMVQDLTVDRVVLHDGSTLPQAGWAQQVCWVHLSVAAPRPGVVARWSKDEPPATITGRAGRHITGRREGSEEIMNICWASDWRNRYGLEVLFVPPISDIREALWDPELDDIPF